MANLLPTKEQKVVLHERTLRIILSGLVLLALTITVALAFLAPLYIFTSHQAETVETQIATTRQIIELRTNAEATMTLEMMRTQLASLQSIIHGYDAYTILEDLVTRIPSDIIVTRIAYRNDTATSLEIAGTASTRDALLNFETRMEQSRFVSNVTLPVSSLAQSEDIPFTLSLALTPLDETSLK